MDAEQFDGLARTVAERGEERSRDQAPFDTLSRLVAAKGSRRVALAGLLGAVLVGQRAQPAAAQCRSKEDKNKRQCRRREREEEDREEDREDEDTAPGGGTCPDKKLRWIAQVCGIIAGKCCPGMTCTPTLTIGVESCQFPCQTDEQCRDKFHDPGSASNREVRCKTDVFACPFLPDARCCQEVGCTFNKDACGRGYYCENDRCFQCLASDWRIPACSKA